MKHQKSNFENKRSKVRTPYYYFIITPMKNIIIVLALTFLSMYSYAQDIIVKRDGSIIQAKVSEIDTSGVKYKKWTNQDGPTYVIAKSDVLAINYPNGEKDTFEETTTSSPTNTTPQRSSSASKASPSPNNNLLIEKYNSPLRMKVEPSKKKAKSAFMIMGVNDNSTLSSEELEVVFVPTTYDMQKCKAEPLRLTHNGGAFQIKIINKTDNIVYIDLGLTFRISKDDESFTYYNSDVIVSSSGSQSGAGFNIGGVTNALGIGGAVGSIAGATTVGGGRSHSISTEHHKERILAIPPHGNKTLSAFDIACAKMSNFRTVINCKAISKNEPIPGQTEGSYSYYFEGKIINKNLLYGEVKEYTPDNSIGINKYQITYSCDPNFTEKKNLYFETYLKYMIGTDSIMIRDYRKNNLKTWNRFIENEESSYIFDFVNFAEIKHPPYNSH